MTCRMCEWLCERLGCLNIQTSQVASREQKLVTNTQRLDEVIGSLESNVHKLETAAIDIKIQKHALEAFAKDITK